MTDTWFAWGLCGDLGVVTHALREFKADNYDVFPSNILNYIQHVLGPSSVRLMRCATMVIYPLSNPVIKWSAKVSDGIIN